MRFKVGDQVVWRHSVLKDKEKARTVLYVDEALNRIGVSGSYGVFPQCDFEHASPKLETELRLCESRRGVLCKRIGEDQEEKKSLEKRIQELQQAIKERDKPKGMIKVGDKIPTQSFLVCASGDVRTHLKNSWSEANVAMGNLFYDKESAERAVHDRKQRVLRGEDV